MEFVTAAVTTSNPSIVFHCLADQEDSPFKVVQLSKFRNISAHTRHGTNLPLLLRNRN
jgi:hypothetical protein